MTMQETVLVTGATGQLGRLVIQELKKVAPASRIIGLARNPEAARDLGVEIRRGSYDDPTSLAAAFAGVDKVLLISSSEIGRRVPQHAAVIEAAKTARVRLLGYTSILRADRNPMALAAEHRETEALIRNSGLPFVILRNGWYHENYTGNLPAVLAHGAVLGAAGEGRISSASRRDYAAAAAVALARGEAGKVHELAGDASFTMADYAAAVAKQAGKAIVYTNLPAADYKAALQSAGLPEAFAGILADSDAYAEKGWLHDVGGELARLTGRPTQSIADAIRAALSRLQ